MLWLQIWCSGPRGRESHPGLGRRTCSRKEPWAQGFFIYSEQMSSYSDLLSLQQVGTWLPEPCPTSVPTRWGGCRGGPESPARIWPLQESTPGRPPHGSQADTPPGAQWTEHTIHLGHTADSVEQTAVLQSLLLGPSGPGSLGHFLFAFFASTPFPVLHSCRSLPAASHPISTPSLESLPRASHEHHLCVSGGGFIHPMCASNLSCPQPILSLASPA